MPEASAPSPLALVTGATGALGPTLLGLLRAKGCRVRVLLQPGDPSRPPSGEIETVEGDITDRRVLEAAAASADYVFHLAAKLHINNPPPQMQAEYERINVQGTQALVEAAQNARVRRLVFFSTISVYGPSAPGELHTERSALRPQTRYAETKARAEQCVLAIARPDDGLPLGAVLRLAAVYGARVKGNYARLWQAVQRGRFLPLGAGRNRRTLVYDKDVAQAAWLAATHPDAAGRAYNVTDGAIHTLAEILTAMRAALGKGPYRVHVPLWPVRAAAQGVAAASHWIGRPYPAAALLDKYLEDVAVDGRAIQTDLGFTPAYDLAAGWHDLLTIQARRPTTNV